jgi:outer membrane protein
MTVMQRSLIATVLCLGLGAAPGVYAIGAPGVDVNAKAYGWQAQPSGTFSTTTRNDTSVDVEDDLDFDKNRNNVFSVAVEHPVPLVPNVRVAAAGISDEQDSTLTQQITYNNQSFSRNSDVSSEYQLDYTEATLYYAPWKILAKPKIGITARRLDMKFAIQNSNGTNRQSVKATQTLPMIHAGVRADLPLTGFYVRGEADAVSYDGNSLTDATAALGWRSDFNLGLELGYRRMNLTLDDVSDIDADFKLGGPFLSLSLAI